jgi:hypothetical protein
MTKKERWPRDKTIVFQEFLWGGHFSLRAKDTPVWTRCCRDHHASLDLEME